MIWIFLMGIVLTLLTAKWQKSEGLCPKVFKIICRNRSRSGTPHFVIVFKLEAFNWLTKHWKQHTDRWQHWKITIPSYSGLRPLHTAEKHRPIMFHTATVRPSSTDQVPKSYIISLSAHRSGSDLVLSAWQSVLFLSGTLTKHVYLDMYLDM